MGDQAARGSDAEYCSRFPRDGHHMVSHSGGKLIPWVEICSLCGWIDTDLLDRYAEDAIKSSISERAQRIAVSADTEPFAFVQPSSGELTLEEILLQALAAASHHAAVLGAKGWASDGKRETAIYKGLLAEVKREVKAERNDAIESTLLTVRAMDK